MADQPITSLPVKTSSGMAATDYLLGIDSAEGYRMLIQDLGDYIIQHATSNLSGSNQTIANAMLGKQATLVSGTNIKTVNNESILGSGNLTIEGLPAVTSSDNGKVLRVVNGAWTADSLISASGVSF